MKSSEQGPMAPLAEEIPEPNIADQEHQFYSSYLGENTLISLVQIPKPSISRVNSIGNFLSLYLVGITRMFLTFFTQCNGVYLFFVIESKYGMQDKRITSNLTNLSSHIVPSASWKNCLILEPNVG